MSNDTPNAGQDTPFRLAPVPRRHVDKRRYPRIDMRLPVTVTAGDHVLETRLRNISAEGMQIRCDVRTATILNPKRVQIPPGAGPEVMVRLELAVGDGQHPFAGRARLCYMMPKGPEEVAFGLKFVHLSLDAKKLLSDFILECLQPAT